VAQVRFRGQSNITDLKNSCARKAEIHQDVRAEQGEQNRIIHRSFVSGLRALPSCPGNGRDFKTVQVLKLTQVIQS
jgi:hypothetical protein